jgi:hypothetical protein
VAESGSHLITLTTPGVSLEVVKIITRNLWGRGSARRISHRADKTFDSSTRLPDLLILLREKCLVNMCKWRTSPLRIWLWNHTYLYSVRTGCLTATGQAQTTSKKEIIARYVLSNSNSLAVKLLHLNK